jgi:ketosteroid isomerase-like protein
MIEALMRSYYTAYNAVDADALSAILAPDVTLVSAMGTQAGRDAYLATFRYMTDRFTDRMTPERIDVAGDVATVRIHDSLTAKADIADFMGRPVAKGQELILTLIGRYTIADGQIARIEIAPAA